MPAPNSTNAYAIKLSAGEATGSNVDQNRREGYLTRWDTDWDVRHWEDIDFSAGDADPYKEGGFEPDRDGSYRAKVCIVDFESYEKISTGLPMSTGIKDSQGNDECELFIRDMAIGDIVGGKYPAIIACGINGLYITDDIAATTVTWTEWTDTNGAFVHDATSVIYDSSTGIIYIGTWGNGVWMSSFDGSTVAVEIDSTLKHKKIWCIFKDSVSDIYIGTEHGGIYRLTT